MGFLSSCNFRQAHESSEEKKQATSVDLDYFSIILARYRGFFYEIEVFPPSTTHPKQIESGQIVGIGLIRRCKYVSFTSPTVICLVTAPRQTGFVHALDATPQETGFFFAFEL